MNGMKGFLLCAAMLCLALALTAQTPEWQWAVNAGGTGTDWGQFIALDSAGNQYVTGYFEDTSSFGDYTLTSSGDKDIFVAKLDPAGNFLWAVKAGGTGWDEGRGVSVDFAGNAYLTGYFYGTASFGSHTLTSIGMSDIFAAKLDPVGNWLWAVSAGGILEDRGYGIAVDDAGNSFLTGYYDYTASFGTHTLNYIGYSDIFVAKLDPNGIWLGAVSAGGTSTYAFGNAIAVDAAGNTYITGCFEYTASFGDYTLTSSGNADIFAAKLDPDGNWLWVSQAGGTLSESGLCIALDSEGNAFLAGYFLGTASFGNYTLSGPVGFFEGFASKLDPNGNWLWAVNAEGSGYTCGTGFAVDGDGNAWLTGWFEGTASFGTHTITSSGSRDIFATKLDPNGNWLWAVKAGGASGDYGEGIAVDGSGNACLTGRSMGTAIFGPYSITSNGWVDIVAAKLSSGTPVDEDLIPEAAAFSRLYDAYPNPLRPGQTATITSNVAERETGILTVLNLRGQILSRHTLSPGSHQIPLASGNLPSGVYLYQLQTGTCSEVKKLVLLK
ncbi:MAG: T9SS type A sorting domain-containing protein [Candidatus Syntrophosphaera sp.]|nr:T9SS type A sorting domain-containing protein [Candidatus Syntrophosphaera sp.]